LGCLPDTPIAKGDFKMKRIKVLMIAASLLVGPMACVSGGSEQPTDQLEADQQEAAKPKKKKKKKKKGAKKESHKESKKHKKKPADAPAEGEGAAPADEAPAE
jgi:hypothetical protein